MDDEEENSSEAFKDSDVFARGSMIPALWKSRAYDISCVIKIYFAEFKVLCKSLLPLI